MIRLGLDDYRPAKVEQRMLTLADFPQLMLNPPSWAGVSVTGTTAQENTAWRNGLVLIAGDVGKIPRHAYQKNDDGTRERLDDSYLERLLRQPNPYINDLDLWATHTMHALACGDAYLEIEWDRALRPIALWPIMPEEMAPYLEGHALFYRYKGKGIPAEDIIHTKGPSVSGLKGDDPVARARHALGLAIAAERFAASFFANGAWPGVALQHPGNLSAGAAERLKASFEDLHKGTANAHRTFVAEEGMKVEKLGTDPDKSQLVELRDHQVVEVARALNIPPHKLKHKMGERPGANLTESELDYLSGTLDPWLTRIEQECNLKLIPKAQRSRWYIEHDRNAYLRMTPDAKAASYKVYYDMKVLSSEQIAKKENLPAPDPDAFPAPPAPFAPAAPAPPEPEPEADQARMASAQRALVVEIVGRFVRREAEQARRASRKGAQPFAAWVAEFYEREGDLLRAYLTPGVELELARRGLAGDAGTLARGLAVAYTERSRGELLDLRHGNLEEGVDRLMSRWEVNRPVEAADAIAALKG
jgi:HK97 family phage portal protein